MKFINFDDYIEKMIMNILIKTVLYHNILVILLFWDKQDAVKQTFCLIFSR